MGVNEQYIAMYVIEQGDMMAAATKKKEEWKLLLMEQERDPDIRREAMLRRGPPFKKALAFSEYWRMTTSVNVIVIKVTESDNGYPIGIFGTVLAKDEYDYILRATGVSTKILAKLKEFAMY
ncbi:hypothetical protein E2562_007216 [Oryza meyeriana var. granulata]|uniref:Uncharacterized protein n=1 Tax=Oryza meyeriana var. granulata TaxID=110450 RepID=A0A6G1CE92_9ORYZ|nr:hypothetical protein E2562_007216 [Oryza meyeriana var. granulata]